MIKSISIRDIAKKAGVAPSTVSSVLNGKSKQARISEKLSEHVRKISEELGYQPNQTAISLRTGKTKIIGLIVEDISNVFFASLAKIVEDEAYAKGYKIVYCSTENDDNKGNELIKMLLQHRVDGFIITPSAGMEEEVNHLLQMQMPVVLMDRYFPGMKVPATLVDNYSGVKKGTQLLIENGYKKIGFVTVSLDQIQMRQREEAFRNTLQENNLALSEEQFLRLPYQVQPNESIEAIESFIKSGKLDAVFFATNYLGLHGIECIKKLNIKVPEELGVICFDDHDIFRLFTPGITILEQPVVQIAKNAVDVLLGQFEGKNVEHGHFEMLQEARLVMRGSC